MSKQVIIDREKCIGCEKCVLMCPKNILYIDEQKKCSVTDANKCDLLRGCERVCPVDAIKVRGI